MEFLIKVIVFIWSYVPLFQRTINNKLHHQPTNIQKIVTFNFRSMQLKHRPMEFLIKVIEFIWSYVSLFQRTINNKLHQQATNVQNIYIQFQINAIKT